MGALGKAPFTRSRLCFGRQALHKGAQGCKVSWNLFRYAYKIKRFCASAYASLFLMLFVEV